MIIYSAAVAERPPAPPEFIATRVTATAEALCSTRTAAEVKDIICQVTADEGRWRVREPEGDESGLW